MKWSWIRIPAEAQIFFISKFTRFILENFLIGKKKSSSSEYVEVNTLFALFGDFQTTSQSIYRFQRISSSSLNSLVGSSHRSKKQYFHGSSSVSVLDSNPGESKNVQNFLICLIHKSNFFFLI